MDSVQALREAVEASGLTHRQVARRMDKHDAYVSQAMRQKSIGGDVLASIAHACGYRLELVPMGGGETITIGDDCAPDRDDAPSLDQARALIARASSILEALDE